MKSYPHWQTRLNIFFYKIIITLNNAQKIDSQNNKSIAGKPFVDLLSLALSYLLSLLYLNVFTCLRSPEHSSLLLKSTVTHAYRLSNYILTSTLICEMHVSLIFTTQICWDFFSYRQKKIQPHLSRNFPGY